MSFLAPLFLLGTLAVALPILFHLIRRTSRERMPFSSLMFLSPTPPRVTRHSRLENILLLLLRCLVLLLLALGFARPFLQKPRAADPSSDTGKRIVLLLDTSASMRRDNLWALAQAKADEVLRTAKLADQVAVFTFDRQARPLVTFEQWSSMDAGQRAGLTMQQVRSVTPGWFSTRLCDAILTAAESFDEKLPEQQTFGLREIVLISDLQEGSHLDGLQGYEWPRDIQVIIEPIRARRTTNSGVQLVTEHDETAAPSSDSGPRIRVLNANDSKREQFQIRWEGVPEAEPLDVYVPPGQNRIFAAPKLAPGIKGERLVLNGDDEEFDNKAFFVQPKADTVSVLYLGNETETDSAQPLYYLKRAFQQTRNQIVQIIARRVDTPLAAAEVQNAHLMIVTESLPEEQVKTAEQFLNAGKTVLFAMKAPAAASTIARLTASPGFNAEEASMPRYAMLAEINFEHPLFLPFADPRFSDFTKIHFWKYRRIEIDKLPRARVLARFDQKANPALVEVPVGKGHLLLLGSGWHPTDSQLALSSKFVPLLYSILEQSGGLKAQRLQYVVGDPVSLVITNGAATLNVTKPDGSTVALPKGDNFTQSDQPGIFTIDAQPPVRFAVNLDPAETKTAPLPVEELERFGVPLKKDRTVETAQREEKKRYLLAAEQEKQQKLWRWMIVAALIMLIAETWLAGRLVHRGPASAEAV
ncbi:MAG: VWA domain-containing protein [Verrucomicrobia bacterium]|nr:VWA domain-containing protein [Verrucomicrobiota bacterium]